MAPLLKLAIISKSGEERPLSTKIGLSFFIFLTL